MRGATVGLAGALLLTGCGGGETTPAATTATGEDVAATPTSAATTAPAGEDDAPAATGEYGTATVRVGGTTTTFTVIQCFEDTPSVSTGDMVALALDGVPTDTPPELIEPLLGARPRPSAGLDLLEPVLALGPILSVVRLAESGDIVQVIDAAFEPISTGYDVAEDPAQRFLTSSTTVA